jgi:hypothetical protein
VRAGYVDVNLNLITEDVDNDMAGFNFINHFWDTYYANCSLSANGHRLEESWLRKPINPENTIIIP